MAQICDAELQRLLKKIERLERENERLQQENERLLWAGQPPPHSRSDGRDAGSRSPRQCPACGGPVAETDLVEQYQTELPEPRVQRIRFRIPVGRCQRCGRRVQGRHPRQTSDAC